MVAAAIGCCSFLAANQGIFFIGVYANLIFGFHCFKSIFILISIWLVEARKTCL